MAGAVQRKENIGEVVISSENVHKTYLLGVEGVAALRGVSVDVQQGELLVIYGTSGGGKSTLLNVLGTIDTPTKGNLSIFGARITDRTPDSVLAGLRNKKVGFVFQSFNLLSTMTALDNVALPMIIAGERSASEIEERARHLLEEVGLGHRVDHYPSMLSGGEQQRVTIARALANDPDVLLLDEPTGDLDTMNTHLILNILMTLNQDRGLTMAMVTHDVYMKQYANRVLYLRDGKVHRVEEVGELTRNAALSELSELVARDQERLKAKRSGNASDTVGGIHRGTAREVLRNPSDYATYSPAANPDSFQKNERPALFQKLFPKHNNNGGGDNASVGRGNDDGTEMQQI
uniref:ABC transporter domain-containing protein n=1 Tax=Neobodo designis TaxID=312471 RepID=A0A7S1Q5D0_NEODS|mmetsp:Transcript_30785/g.95095  ORF Transcript_30785/g.95095 Transcript_30785/m.95095 type:complete len:347 (+) Transcript_30785:47-1087(+)|eukprot:CAMPEP_0174849820 /NCGR_PEP_ID=MMETSP1114-20130205/17564_1 /TAXON_ID=312471 /ORGANISM="Neobodo designis, Strain CCAP 1951/1" /LENGTH=346 /DNA_ID=CAMNT_0016084227 /DNA_START=47 /DNA_END=1087 /DNA_ORIENTATION=+